MEKETTADPEENTIDCGKQRQQMRTLDGRLVIETQTGNEKSLKFERQNRSLSVKHFL